MADNTQGYANHSKRPPLPYMAALLGLPAVTLFLAYRMVRDFSVDAVALFVLALGTMLVAGYARTFPLRVQDRLIRLEERLRLERLLPDDLKGQIEELTTGQLIGLRFASDAEVEELVRRVLAGELSGRKEIKQAVRDWRADHQRI